MVIFTQHSKLNEHLKFLISEPLEVLVGGVWAFGQSQAG